LLPLQTFFALQVNDNDNDWSESRTMMFGVRFRLLALGLAFGLVGATIAWIVVDFQRQTRELQTKLNQVDTESGQISAQFKDELREVNNTQLQYAVSHDPAVWEQFLKASRQLNQWLDGQALRLTSQSEKDSLREVKAAYDSYLKTIGEIPRETNGSAQSSDVLAAFKRVRTESQHLFDLGQSLANTHYKSRNQLLADAGQRLQGLRLSELVLLGLLFLFGLALAGVAYRDMIAPLRVQLVESKTLVERHEKLASLGMLAAGVAHEIRNPLTAIKAALFIQQKRFGPGSPERADNELVQNEITRLERIVTDFLRFARPSDPEFGTLPADQLLRDVQLIFAAQAEKAEIRLVLDVSAAWRVRVDPAQIKQVLINLVQNGIDSIGRDGTITLRARRDRRALSGEEQEVVILEVADTGKGIPPEVGKRLFDPFFTTKDDGTGLGLSIAARIVEKHGGALQYQTQTNRGTTFGIVLPQAREEGKILEAFASLRRVPHSFIPPNERR
jgi:signal transduction histidine kinase